MTIYCIQASLQRAAHVRYRVQRPTCLPAQQTHGKYKFLQIKTTKNYKNQVLGWSVVFLAERGEFPDPCRNITDPELTLHKLDSSFKILKILPLHIEFNN
jgi:hypothetical protein